MMTKAKSARADSSPEQPAQKRRATSGSFKPGLSGNPGGRVGVPKEVREAARELSDRAIKRLEHWMDSDNPKASITATLSIIERAWGKTVQALEITGKDGAPVQMVTTYNIPTNARDIEPDTDAGN
jgi:hypothetical protein